MTGFDLSRFRVGLGGAHGKRDMHRVLERGTCDLSAGDDLYLFPSAGANVTSSSAVTFKWDPDCLPAVTSIDLYLYTTSQGLLHSFPGVDYSKGEYAAGELDPRWWNYTTKASVYLAIVDANVPRWLSQVPVGPTFNLYTAQDALSTTIVQGGTTIVTAASAVIASSKQAAKATATTTGVNGTAPGAASDDPGMFSSAIAPAAGLPKGAIAAAIVVPVLVVGLMVALYVKFARLREREKRKRWSEHVDKRMSVLSSDWRQGAPTASIYSQGAGRPTSMFSTATGAAGGATGRPVSAWTKNSSVYAMENNVAGRGVAAFRGPPSHARRPSSSFTDNNNNNQLRPASIFTVSNSDLATMPGGVRTSHVSFADGRGGGARQSRVSFGDALRPSKSTLSINVLASTSNNNSSAANKGKRMSRAEPSPTAGRHSIDGAHAMMASRSVRGTDVATVSPTQAAGPFAVPAPRGRSGSTSGGGGVAGFFSTITSAVGLKDKKQATTPPAAGEMGEEEWKQAERTRRSADGVRDMEAIMLRRSQAISQYSQYSNPPSGAPPANDTRYNNDENVAGATEGDDAIELLDTTMSPSSIASPSNGNPGTMRAPSPMGMMGMPMGATANPDQLLAAYAAARAAAKSPTAGIGQSIEQRGAGAGVGEGSGNAMTELAAAAGVAPLPTTAREEDK